MKFRIVNNINTLKDKFNATIHVDWNKYRAKSPEQAAEKLKELGIDVSLWRVTTDRIIREEIIAERDPNYVDNHISVRLDSEGNEIEDAVEWEVVE